MKNYIVFLIIISGINSAVAQDKMIAVNDIRKAGVTKHDHDTATSGRFAREVLVNRSLSVKPEYFQEKGKKDTIDTYQIHFFKMYENKLMNYDFSYSDDVSFDKASYRWLNDTVVSITLINSETRENRNLQLVQAGNSAGIMKGSFK